jgi:hypothetical protein
LKARVVAAVRTNPVSVERNSLWKNSCWNRWRWSSVACTHSSRGTRENAFCERQDAFYVEFFELTGVPLNSHERQLLASFFG